MEVVVTDPADLWDVLTAIGTVGAVVVALALAGSRWVAEQANRPQLDLTYDPTNDLSGEATEDGSPVAYIRLGVSNKAGRHAATGVEVLVVRSTPLEPTEGYRDEWNPDPVKNLGPLGWTHTTPPELTIGPGIRRTVDLGYAPKGGPRFGLALQALGNVRAHELVPGTHRITLAVGGSNSDAEHYELTLGFEGGWNGQDATIPKALRVVAGPSRVAPPA